MMWMRTPNRYVQDRGVAPAVALAVSLAAPVSVAWADHDDCAPGEPCDRRECLGDRSDCDPPPPSMDPPAAYPADHVGSECGWDGDCPPGYSCQVRNVERCYPASCDGAYNCPPPYCRTETATTCARDRCASAADCENGLACLVVEFFECEDDPPTGCEPGYACPEHKPAEQSCWRRDDTICGPGYAAPCRGRLDCGEGFVCAERAECDCPHYPDPDEGYDDAHGEKAWLSSAESTGCECRGVDEYYCLPLELPCGDQGDCPAGWGCVAPESIPCVPYTNPEGLTFCEPPATHGHEAFGRCSPPYWSRGWAINRDGTRDALIEAGFGPEAEVTGVSDNPGDITVVAPLVRGPGVSGGGCHVDRRSPHGSPPWSSFAGAAGILVIASALRRRRAGPYRDRR